MESEVQKVKSQSQHLSWKLMRNVTGYGVETEKDEWERSVPPCWVHIVLIRFWLCCIFTWLHHMICVCFYYKVGQVKSMFDFPGICYSAEFVQGCWKKSCKSNESDISPNNPNNNVAGSNITTILQPCLISVHHTWLRLVSFYQKGAQNYWLRVIAGQTEESFRPPPLDGWI